jgi:hypothetical protein
MSHLDPVLAGVLASAAAAAEEEACDDPEHCRNCCCEDLDAWGFDDEETGDGFDCPWCGPVP